MAARWWVWLQLSEETESHFQNKLRVDTLLPLAHNNSPSKPAGFKSANCCGAPKVGSLLGETPMAAGMRKEDTCWGHDTDCPYSLYLLPPKAIFKSLLQTHTWPARATQVNPDSATLILPSLFIYTCPHLHPQACLLLQNTPPRTEAPSQSPDVTGHHPLCSGSPKEQTEQKCTTYKVSWVSYLLLEKKKKSSRIKIL